MLTNINYRCRVCLETVGMMNFPKCKPQQYIDKTGKYTIIFFKNGKCRIMGCKKPVEFENLQYNIKDIQVQSLTIATKVEQSINLNNLAKLLDGDCIYEPELFPALRYTKYNPLCVNIFSSGKIVVLGIKNLDFHTIVEGIINYVKNLIRSLTISTSISNEDLLEYLFNNN